MTNQNNIEISKENLISQIRFQYDYINSNVLANQTMLVESIRRDNFDAIELECNNNQFEFRDFEDLEDDQKQEILENLSLSDEEINEDNFDEYKEDIINEAKSYGYIYDDEPYQYFLVEDYFLKLLEEKGEIVANFQDQEQWWGRCAAGQSILLDGVIQDIAKDNIAYRLNISLEKLDQLFKEYEFGSAWLCNVNCL